VEVNKNMGIQSTNFMSVLFSVGHPRTEGRREDDVFLSLWHYHVGSRQAHRATGPDVRNVAVNSHPDHNYNRVYRGLDKCGDLDRGDRNAIVGSQKS